jgi:hypothetical protein
MRPLRPTHAFCPSGCQDRSGNPWRGPAELRVSTLRVLVSPFSGLIPPGVPMTAPYNVNIVHSVSSARSPSPRRSRSHLAPVVRPLRASGTSTCAGKPKAQRASARHTAFGGCLGAPRGPIRFNVATPCTDRDGYRPRSSPSQRYAQKPPVVLVAGGCLRLRPRRATSPRQQAPVRAGGAAARGRRRVASCDRSQNG